MLRLVPMVCGFGYSRTSSPGQVLYYFFSYYVTLQFCDYLCFHYENDAYSNILKILQPKKGKKSDKKILIFFIFVFKT